MSGRKLSHYEIIEKIGAGGMGEVYRARDTKLGREVALKLLPELFARDEERLGRFKREAKLLASLNHAHIATLHGLEEADDQPFLVMELVEGEDLAQRLSRGSMPASEALRIVRDVADALQAAHAQGIVHRDLKPANIKVTPEGRVKVLDFGLAKALESDPSTRDMTQSPTIATGVGTMGGVILGTAAYMSPEQARGRPVDKLTDVWALGAVLFEMLTGSHAFPGETLSDTIAKILEREPNWSLLPSDTPPAIQRLLRRCLEKDKSMRLQDVGEVRVEAAGALSGSSQAWSAQIAPAGEESPARRRGGRAGWFVGAIGIALAALFAVLYVVDKPAPPTLLRSAIPQPPDARFVSMGDYGGPVVISPDGRRVAFCANDSNLTRMLWVRDLSALEARPIPGTVGAQFPFWSPKGDALGYFDDNRLMRVDLSGGLPISVCDAVNGRGGAWNEDGVILFSPDFQAGLVEVPANGGTPVQVTTLDPTKHSTHRWPVFMPDGDHFIFIAAHHDISYAKDYGIYFGSLSSGEEPKRVIPTACNAIFGSGHLLYLRESTLMAVPFDPVRGEVTGEPVAMTDKVQNDPTTWRASFSVSHTGILAYNGASGEGPPTTRLSIIDRSGREVGSVEDAHVYYHLRVSPDGHRVACTSAESEASSVGLSAFGLDILVYDLDRGVRTRLSFHDGADVSPIWSPDGTEIAYSTIFPGLGLQNSQMYIAEADGGGERLVLEDSLDSWCTDWSRDGRYLIYSKGAYVGVHSEIWCLPLAAGAAPFRLITDDDQSDTGVLSPDGRWIAYSTQLTGTSQIYVAPFTPPVEAGGNPNDHRRFSKWQVSTEADVGSFPVWNPSGKEIFFIKADGTIRAVDVDGSGDAFRAGRVHLLCRTDPWNFGRIGYDIMPDGEHFIVNSFSQEATPPITLVQNWTLELSR